MPEHRNFYSVITCQKAALKAAKYSVIKSAGYLPSYMVGIRSGSANSDNRSVLNCTREAIKPV